ncbi:MAG: 23S rRNA (uracil(1939)-C(5))-methyltransferase RlmD, partial [bacterium]
KAALKVGAEVELEVEDVAFGGSGVARCEGLVCFVRFGVPGDVVRAVVRKKKRKHRECDILEVIQPSPLRVEPRCAHFGDCGGCSFQNIKYEEQLRFKEKHVRDCIERIGGLRGVPVEPIVGMDDPWFYRNKMEYTFGQDAQRRDAQRQDGEIALGLKRRGRFDRVVDVEECFLQSPVSNRLLAAVRELARGWGLPPYNPRTHEGFLKNLAVRVGSRRKDGGCAIMVCLVTATGITPGEFPQINELKETIARDFPEVKSLYRFRNPEVSGVAIAGEAELVAGAPHIEETICGLRFRVSPGSFLQVNVRQAENLYEKIVEFAGLTGGERVVDLYTGAGPIALLLARGAREVVGVESVEEAVRDARFNAEANGVGNVQFVAGAAEKVLGEVLEAGKPDLVVADPPRAGIHPKALKALLKNPPARMVYVSCNPSTLARDLQSLTESGYSLKAVHPIDMFPHTAHVESVTLLERS